MFSKNQIRILVADDSQFGRSTLSDYLQNIPMFVADFATNGNQILSKIRANKPDVVCFNIDQEQMGGLQGIRNVMSALPTPIVLFSLQHTGAHSLLQEGLQLGAIDCVSVKEAHNLEAAAEILVNKLELAASIKVVTRRYGASLENSALLQNIPPNVHTHCLVVIGASTGGPSAITGMLPKLAEIESSNICYLIVMHMPPEFTAGFVANIRAVSQLDCREAKNNDPCSGNQILVAPGDRHLTISKKRKVLLRKQKADYLPSVNLAMQSAAQVYGRNVIGVILTGMGDDGLEGMRAIKNVGGKTIAQDQETSTVFGMPRACIEANLVDCISPLERIPYYIQSLVSTLKFR